MQNANLVSGHQLTWVDLSELKVINKMNVIPRSRSSQVKLQVFEFLSASGRSAFD